MQHPRKLSHIRGPKRTHSQKEFSQYFLWRKSCKRSTKDISGTTHIKLVVGTFSRDNYVG